MNNKPQNAPDAEVKDGLLPFAWVEVVVTLLRWRKFILYNFFLVSVCAVIVSFFMPKWYKSTASILPPKDQGLLSPFGISSSVLKSLGSTSRFAGLPQRGGSYNYLAILNSRSAMEAVISKFDLITVYQISDSSKEKTIEELEENVVFEVQDNDNITIEVADKDPQRASDIANFFVQQLNSISIKLGTQEARNNREFIEKRLEQIREDLKLAEDALKGYQEKSGVMISTDENSASVRGVAELYGLKARREIELSIMKRTVTGENSSVQQLELEVNEINRKLATLPKTGLESLRLYRDVLIQQKIVEYLVPLYEQAKIDEQKDVPVILVLDKATPAERKFKPKRLIIVSSAGFTAMLLSIIVAFSVERIQYLKRINPTRFSLISDLFKRQPVTPKQ